MKQKKGHAQKIRPFEGDNEIAKKIADSTGLDVIDVMSLALSAGLHAIQENGYAMPLPLEFKVEAPKTVAPRKGPYPEAKPQGLLLNEPDDSSSKRRKTGT